MSKLAVILAILKTGAKFALEEFRRNLDRYGLVGTFHKKSRGRHCRPGRVSRSERVRNRMLKANEFVTRAAWGAQHSLSVASSYVCRAPEMVNDLRSARRIALDRMMVELRTPGLRNQRMWA